MSADEAIERFDCFGSSCGVFVIGDTPTRSAAKAAADARTQLLEWHERFSRFRPGSELSLLNADARAGVPVSPLMACLARAVRMAGDASGGLVDATLVEEIREAGYDGELGPRLPLKLALGLAPPRRPAGPSQRRGWERLRVDSVTSTLLRPPGLMIDSGGIAKGLFADLIAEQLGDHDSFAVDCGGDIALGGSAGLQRPIEVQSPFDGAVIHRFHERHGAAATSGIGRRGWLDSAGRAAHHLLDPATGRPAFTGVVQATALAPSALLAEVHAKAAVLSGPERAATMLPWGGVVVFDDGSRRVVPARAAAQALRAA
jgi:FAD:protein FMN transferase